MFMYGISRGVLAIQFPSLPLCNNTEHYSLQEEALFYLTFVWWYACNAPASLCRTPEWGDGVIILGFLQIAVTACLPPTS